MDILYFIAIGVPLLVGLFAVLWMGKTITPFEGLSIFVVISLLITGIWFAGRYTDTWDTELWNGEITGKQMAQQSCPIGWNDYTDNFCTEYSTRRVRNGETCSTTGSGKEKRRTCTPNYKTQYRYDYSWERKYFVYTNIKADFQYDRVDRQGRNEPPEWSAVYKGQPASAPKGYTNWIQGASDNLFHVDADTEDKYKAILPPYPMGIYDHFKVDRVVSVGNVPNAASLNLQLAEALKTLGPQKQMNAIVVLVDTKIAGQDFPYALRRAWGGFKKNDAIIFLGVENGTLKWSDVMSWSKANIFNVELRDKLNEGVDKPLNLNSVAPALLEFGIKDFQRREMKEFEYLKDQIPVPMWLTILVSLLSFGGSAGLLWLFHVIDFNPIERFRRG